MDEIKLSVILPRFTMATTLERALDSIFMQKINFGIEVLVVDDGSSDSTVEVSLRYAEKHPEIRVLRNEENAGNAEAFYHGLSNARGKYFCVLDQDGYYAIPGKLQRQVDFLDGDLNEEYVAATHYSVIDLGDGTIHIPARSMSSAFNYADFLTENAGHFHTGAYMYRNIFRDNPLEYFNDALYCCDTPRTAFHLMYSGGKVRILDFVGAVCSPALNGGRSNQNESEPYAPPVKYYTQFQKTLSSPFERESIQKIIDANAAGLQRADQYERISLDSALLAAHKMAGRFAFAHIDFTLKGLYHSLYLDTLCATLGFIYDIHHPENVQTEADDNAVAIFVGRLIPKGGGIFDEIVQTASLYAGRKTVVYATLMDAFDDTLQKTLQEKGIEAVCYAGGAPEGKLDFFKRQLKQLSPSLVYCFTSHDDPYCQALLTSCTGKRISPFSFDHGFLLGISNPYIDTIIARRPADFTLLKKYFGGKVIYIPTAGTGFQPDYQPFCAHDRLITASAAARSYKINGAPPYRYIDYILALLKKTGGKHYHFGPIDEDMMRYIAETTGQLGLPSESFVCIPWAGDLGKAFRDFHIDVFIEPFPTVSYKITLAALAAGMPVATLRAYRRMEITDFCYEGNIEFRNIREFTDKLSSLTASELEEQSRRAVRFYRENHYIETVRGNMYRVEDFGCTRNVYMTDCLLNDINDYDSVYGKNTVRMLFHEFRKEDPRAANPKTADASPLPGIVAQLNEIYNSRSYRVGYALLHPIRRVKSGRRHVESYTPSQIGEAEAELARARHSRTMKLGHALVAPAGLAKKLLGGRNNR